MSAPTTLTPSLILQSAKLAQGYAAIDRATRNALYGGMINELLPEQICLIRKSIQPIYDVNPNEPTLVGTTNYLWSLLGVYGLRALSALGQAGGEVIIIPTGSGGHVISIAGQIVQLVVGDFAQANPTGSPTPDDGDTVVTINYKVMPDSENIFYAGVIVKKYGTASLGDNYYIPMYGSATTIYTFRDPLTEGFPLKFDFMKIVSEGTGGTGTGGTGLQAVYTLSTTTSNFLTVDELGTFMFAQIRGATYDNTVITQTGQDLDLTNVGGAIAGETYLIIYYPSSVA